MATILYGKPVAESIRSALRSRIAVLKEKKLQPGLVVVLAGNDDASAIYVRNKGRACEELGIFSETIFLPENVREEDLLSLIDRLNADTRFHGILVQLPLPGHINEKNVIHRISPDKDVDAFHPCNIGKLVLGEDTFLPCTPAGILEMFKYYSISTEGKHVVIVGRSNIVGKPMANLMYQKSKANATVTICHTGTRDLKRHTLQADILIVAAGVPEMITEDMVKDGVILVDVGMNRVEDASKPRGYRLTGDADFAGIRTKAKAITPVPKGVGLMTISMLMSNTVLAAEKQV
jgi:methylenetetrahydrofolate dehydrogenase (NADP+) / methenyltetrahydrofolate cyclohydrolase